MWPNRSPGREIQEVERTQGRRRVTRSSLPHNNFSNFSDEESDDGAFHSTGPPIDFLLLTSIGTYVLSDPSSEMASTSCIESPRTRLMYYPQTHPQSSTPERRLDGDQPSLRSESDNIHTRSEPVSDDENESLNSTLSTLSRELTNASSATSTNDLSRIHAQHVLRQIRRYKTVQAPEPVQRRRRLHSLRMGTSCDMATKVANRVIKYARCIGNMYEKDMCCLNCGLFPINPVTGQCGHTRCARCIEDKRFCPCGNDTMGTPYINILIRDLIVKSTSDDQSPRATVTAGDITAEEASTTLETLLGSIDKSCAGPMRHPHRGRPDNPAPYSRGYQRTAMSPRVRYNYALQLLKSGRYREAAPHLALTAASWQADSRPARRLLAQTIAVLSKDHEPRGLTRQINQCVRNLSSTWRSFKQADLECILCCESFNSPVTTPCGHIFCRTCIERTMDYNKRCPLCLRPLNNFNLAMTRDTLFIQAALRSINAITVPPPVEPDLIPIFVCTVAFPSVPCPLFIFDPRYWLMIRRVLESGSRKFGMVAPDRGQDYADYGTILEVRDCVHLEDGRSILSTIGLTRFKVIERGVRDGCEVARILPIQDVAPVDDMEVWDLKFLATQLMIKAQVWLNQLNNNVRADIEAAFGRLPSHGNSDANWWESADGPSWLWWLVAVLPLRSEIKVLVLSTDCLLKRMLAVSRTIEAVDHFALQAANTTEYVSPNAVSNNGTMPRGS